MYVYIYRYIYIYIYTYKGDVSIIIQRSTTLKCTLLCCLWGELCRMSELESCLLYMTIHESCLSLCRMSEVHGWYATPHSYNLHTCPSARVLIWRSRPSSTQPANASNHPLQSKAVRRARTPWLYVSTCSCCRV